MDLQGTGSQAHEADPNHKNEVGSASENPFTDKSLINKSYKGDDSTTDDRIELLGEINKSSQLYVSEAFIFHEIEGSSAEARTRNEEEGMVPINQYGAADHNSDQDEDKDSGNGASDGILSSSELSQKESNSLVQVHNHESESFSSSLKTETQIRHSSSEYNCDGEKEVAEDDFEDATENLSAVIETESPCSSEDNCDGGNKEFENELQNTSEKFSPDNKELENVPAGGLLILTNVETFPHTVTKDQIFTADSISREGISLNNLLSPHREMQQVEGGVVPGFQRISSEDTLENTSRFHAKGDFGVTFRSSTARNYYGYDVGASSNETDDQVPSRRFQQLKGSLKVSPERSEHVMNNVTSNESKLQLMNFGSSLQGKKHSTTKVSRWHQDEILERARYRSPVRHRMRNETDDYHSRLLFSKYRFQDDQGNRNSSNYGQKDFSTLPNNPNELHTLELLRMVYELQDQLKKTQLSEGRPRGRFLNIPSKEKEHHIADNRKDYSDLAYPNYHEKYRQDITWLKNRELSQMVLPEDPMHYMHRVDCSCSRCCRHEQYHTAQKAPHAICYSEEQSMTYAQTSSSRQYHSASSNAHHYATSEFSSWSQDMEPDDQWYNKNKEARIHHIAKRHLQPKAGGAPIVACYHCSEMLQLPAESLLFKRRCHQLKCSACSKVLKFSLENKIHVVRYDLIPRTSLPSVIAENSRVMKKHNLPSAYRGSDRPLADPAASSDDSQSFSRSYSTGDNFSATPGNLSSASSFKTPKEGTKSKSTRESVFKNKSFVESFKSAVSSFNMPDSEHSGSESEVESPHPVSTLHKLMGYSSIRRLVYQ